MNERPNKASGHQSDGSRDPRSASKPPMRREELDKILQAHQKWLDTEGAEEKQADLSKTNLMEADLSETRLHRVILEGAYLRGCDLKGANLNDAKFSGANLNRARLNEASLFGADLKGASLVLTELHRTDLQGADLRGANLNRADLKGAYLFGAKLQGAKLNRADLTDANLSRADLTGASLVAANLQGALLVATDLGEANLQEARLSGANLQEAKLQKARLNQTDFEQPEPVKESDPPERISAAAIKPANLTNASFQEADLSDAKLSDVAGLQSHQLAGADLSNAKLPEDLKKFEALSHVEELSRHARTIFLGLIGGCVFSWLTIATTTDMALLTSSADTPLPIIQTKVPIAGFYLAAPVILLALYFYLHLYLQNLWESLASLPAIFPDGRKLDQRAYPWLLMSLVRMYVPMLRADPQTFSKIKFGFSVVSAWCLVPFTLALFWFRYLPRHDWIGLALLVLGFFIAVYWGRIFFLRAKTVLRADGLARPGVIIRPATLIAAAAVIAVPISFWTMVGGKRENLNLLGYHLYADLKDADLSTKPVSWTGIGSESEVNAQIAQVKGAHLATAELRLAFAPGAFLVKANLSRADLWGANLLLADLRGANLRGADLRGTDLRGANLRGAHLRYADLRGADLRGTDLRGANLRGADLKGAVFGQAYFSQAGLLGTNLSHADLTITKGLTQAQLDKACANEVTNLQLNLKIKVCSDEGE